VSDQLVQESYFKFVGFSVAVGLVKALNDYLSNPPDYSKGKECDCVLLLLSQMYNFKMIHCVLIYDIIRKLLTELTERDLDLVILILRSCGMEIRRNDSSSLKDIICDINTKALKVESTSRVRYMLEVVGAIKNNNVHKIPKFDPTLLEHMKKVMRGLAKGSLSDSSQLRLTYDELLKSDSKGQMLSLSDSKVTSPHTRTSGGSNIEKSILDLARKQRMNTDIRRTVFAVIISSEVILLLKLFRNILSFQDFIDAFEKLIALKLSNIQERDIIYVTVTCCLQEKSFNPFYAFLCQKLLEYKKDHQITFQYCLWDHLKVLDTLPSFQAGNLQKLIVHLLKRRAVSLSILKVVNFTVLVGTEKLFYQTLLQSFISGLSPYQFKNVMSNLNKDMKKELCWFIKDNVLTTDNDELHLVIENLLEENFE
jgi:nucleolar MIF4G domain-containing protein 1